MDLKSTLRAITLELRHELEGKYDGQGSWQPGDLERRLAAIGVRRDRSAVPVDELSYLSADDREARRVVDAFIQSRAEAGQDREAAIADFVRAAAYSWANRLLALRCMEARGLIDEVILQKDAYGGRSLQHQRLARKEPERCSDEDDGLFAVLFEEFGRRAKELPLLFDPKAAEVTLRPSVAALKRSIALLSGALASKGQEVATNEVFTAPDALGWTYQFWNTEEKGRVFEKVRTNKGTKIEGADIIPATCIYTEPYMVKFLVQNSLGAMWMGMNPSSRLYEEWEYYVRDADRASVSKKTVSEITFLDPACGSGHFLIEAFELYYVMYLEEGIITDPAKICTAILERNLYGIDIDERAIQIAALALVMKAKEKALDFVPRHVNLIPTNIRLPAGKEHLEAFLRKHPEDTPLKPALLAIFEGLVHAKELGSLLQIEEPVEKELHTLKATFEAAGSPGEQQALWAEFRKPVQGMLPIGVTSYEAWKHDVITRLRQHFFAEAEASDLATAFFGEAARKGLSLVDLVSRRYDVVTANPPYMGSRNMGTVVKGYVERHFAAGKRDLYAAFILRCMELLEPSGIAALVTMNKWLHARAYASLRCGRTLSATGVEQGERSKQNVLWDRSISILADLGSRAFDPDNHFHSGVQVALFVVTNIQPAERASIVIMDCVEPGAPEGKDHLLREAANGVGDRRAPQRGFASLPGAPLCYRLPAPLLAVLQISEPLGGIARVRQGICTTCDPRFVRMHWEVPKSKRWFGFAKGGGHRRWDGLRYFAVDWDYDGTRIKQFITDTPHAIHWSGRMPESDYYYKEGWCFSRIAFGNLGIRHFRSSDLFGHTNPIILFNDGVEADARWAHAGLLNSPLVSYVLRAITQSNDFHEGYLRRLPYPRPSADLIRPARVASETALAHAQAIVAGDLREPTFRFRSETIREDCASSFADLVTRKLKRRLAHELVVSVCERTLQLLSYSQWMLGAADATALDKVIGGTKLPIVWAGLPAEAAEVSRLADAHEPGGVSDKQVDDLVIRAAEAYLAGGSSERVDSDDELPPTEDEEDGEPGEVSHWPSFGTVDGFAKSQRVDLGRAYQALAESIDRYGPGRELVAAGAQEMIGVIALRLLGHRWPTEVNAGLSALTETDGIIPISGSIAEHTLLGRVRDQITAEFGAQRAPAIERELEDVLGQSLGTWLAASLFKRHISQFKKRPIAWQIESAPSGDGKRQGRRWARRAPAFSCLVYYRRLDADLLPKLRTQYVGPLRTSLQTELAGLETVKARTADQDARRLELEEKLEELKAFDTRLEEVTVGGFSSTSLDALVVKEPLDKWTSRSERAPEPNSREAFLAQERRYDPDLNDGVRVNIAPLQRAGLLAGNVLATKDVEKAIADRAQWRADERHWCREGKLPRPGWWHEDPAEAAPSAARQGDGKVPATQERT
jgi:hypothetical protein